MVRLLVLVAALAAFTPPADAGILYNMRSRIHARRTARANGERPVLQKLAKGTRAIVSLPVRAFRARRATVNARRSAMFSNSAGVSANGPAVNAGASCANCTSRAVEVIEVCPNGRCPL